MAQIAHLAQQQLKRCIVQPAGPARRATKPARHAKQAQSRVITVAATGPESTDDLFEELAKVPGVRVVFEPPPTEDEDEEDWEDMMAELSNPWEGVAAPEDDVLDGNIPAAGSTSITLEPPALEVAEVQDVAGPEALAALLQQHPDLVVLDVRQQEEWQAGHLPGSRHCPIKSLTGDEANQLASQHVLVLGTGDYRGSQACVRLTRVYYAQSVYFYEPGIPGWPQHLTIPA